MALDLAAGHGKKQQPPRSLERLIGSPCSEKASLSARKVEALFHGKRRIDRAYSSSRSDQAAATDARSTG